MAVVVLTKRHAKKAILVVVALAYVGMGVWTGDLDWTTAATKFITIVGLGSM